MFESSIINIFRIRWKIDLSKNIWYTSTFGWCRNGNGECCEFRWLSHIHGLLNFEWRFLSTHCGWKEVNLNHFEVFPTINSPTFALSPSDEIRNIANISIMPTFPTFSPFSLSTLWGLQFAQFSVFGHYFEEWDISAIVHVSIFFSSQNTVNSVISTWPIIMLLNLLLGDERLWVSFNSKWNVRKCWKCYQRQLFRDKIQRLFTFLRQKQRCGFSFALIPGNCCCCWYPQFLMENWYVWVTRNTFWPNC